MGYDLAPFGALHSAPHLGVCCAYRLSPLPLPPLSCCRQARGGRKVGCQPSSAVLLGHPPGQHVMHTRQPPSPSPAGPIAAPRVVTRTRLLCRGTLVEVDIPFHSPSVVEYTIFFSFFSTFFFFFSFFYLLPLSSHYSHHLSPQHQQTDLLPRSAQLQHSSSGLRTG